MYYDGLALDEILHLFNLHYSGGLALDGILHHPYNSNFRQITSLHSFSILQTQIWET
jgi:hypothetical protein